MPSDMVVTIIPKPPTEGPGNQLSTCSQAAVDHSPRGSHSVGLEASPGCVSVMLAFQMWKLGSHPPTQKLLLLPWDPHTSVRRTGPGAWAPALGRVAGHRPREEHPGWAKLRVRRHKKMWVCSSLLRLPTLWTLTPSPARLGQPWPCWADRPGFC